MRIRNAYPKDEFSGFINTDDALFHYTKKVSAIEGILPSCSLRFGRFSNANDPQEYRQKLTGAIGWGWGEEGCKKIGEATHTIELLYQHGTQFLSFCMNTMDAGSGFQSGLLRSRMWAQYGDNHEGACFVFSKRKIIESVDRAKEPKQVFLNSAVTYTDSDKIEPMLKINGSELADRDSQEIGCEFFFANTSRYIFRKQVDYRDEQEYRLAIINKQVDCPDIKSFSVGIAESLKGVVFGDRFPVLYSPTIKELVKKLNLPTKILRWHKSGYDLFNLPDKQ